MGTVTYALCTLKTLSLSRRNDTHISSPKTLHQKKHDIVKNLSPK